MKPAWAEYTLFYRRLGILCGGSVEGVESLSQCPPWLWLSCRAACSEGGLGPRLQQVLGSEQPSEQMMRTFHPHTILRPPQEEDRLGPCSPHLIQLCASKGMAKEQGPAQGPVAPLRSPEAAAISSPPLFLLILKGDKQGQDLQAAVASLSAVHHGEASRGGSEMTSIEESQQFG